MFAALLVFFSLAAFGDIVTVWWHRCREADRVFTTSLLSGVLEVLTWLPLWFAITLDDWRIAVACVLGSMVGTGIGMRRALPKT
jgi:hypothetical protein